ncbi:MAG: amphi-Trp domain-containing protein [Candidatus Nanohaloarchaea archaeon]
MTQEEIDLDFEFNNDELANFLESFADKLRQGDVGLSFKGREEVEIEPNRSNQLDLEFEEGEKHKKLEIEVELYEEIEETQQGRQKIDVKVV